MKTYQSQLQIAIAKPQPRPLPPQPKPSSLDDNTGHIASAIISKLKSMVDNGYWYCNNCKTCCVVVEGKGGQQDHCGRCRSPRVVWVQPLHELIEPGDL